MLGSTYTEFGDAQGGFSTRLDVSTLYVKAWGFWDNDVAERFGPAVLDLCQATPGLRRLEFDMTELKPMRDEGQEGFGQIMGALADLPKLTVLVTTSSPLTKLQLLRIARERAPSGAVQFTQV